MSPRGQQLPHEGPGWADLVSNESKKMQKMFLTLGVQDGENDYDWDAAGSSWGAEAVRSNDGSVLGFASHVGLLSLLEVAVISI